MQSSIKELYNRIRANGATATAAYTQAQNRLAAGVEWWNIKSNKPIEYNPADKDGLRWLENASNGLRFHKFADEISQWIKHKGWYTDEDGMNGETLRGAVYRLPARAGKEQFIAGYDDPNNEGSARLDFSTIYNDENVAAKSADQIAERVAESEREYNEAWQAGSDYQTAGEELTALRIETIELIKAVKLERKRDIVTAPVICKALLTQIKNELRDYAKLKEKRASLLDDFSAAWRADIWPAFCDGAGIQIKQAA